MRRLATNAALLSMMIASVPAQARTTIAQDWRNSTTLEPFQPGTLQPNRPGSGRPGNTTILNPDTDNTPVSPGSGWDIVIPDDPGITTPPQFDRPVRPNPINLPSNLLDTSGAERACDFEDLNGRKPIPYDFAGSFFDTEFEMRSLSEWTN